MREATTSFIFDFDGTLADSMPHVVPLYNSIAERFGVPQVSAEDVARLRSMSPTQALDAFGIPLWKVPSIMTAVRQGLRSRMDRLEPFDGIRDALAALRRSGANCLLLTSNSRENVEAFLTRHGLDVFARLSCGTSLFGKGPRLRRLLRESALRVENVAYVGDETRDVEAAKSVGMRSIAVTWGYAARESLLRAAPDLVVDHPRELERLSVRSDM